jgi:predicted nucleic acid-binding protein
MTDKIFLDTNLWVYLFSDETKKREYISQLIGKNFNNICLSAQVLSELFNVLTRKKIAHPEKARQIVHRVAGEFPVSVIDKEIVKQAVDLNLSYHYSYWDSLIIAAALEVKCNILYTEDFQHNQVIEKKLKIINPFKDND